MRPPLPASRWSPTAWRLVVGLLGIAVGVVLLESDAWLLGTILWGIGLGFVVWAWLDRATISAYWRPNLDRREGLAVGALVVVGTILRLWRLDSYPSGVHVDEAAMGLVALDVLQGQGVHPFGFAFIGDPVPFMYVEALMMWLTGVGIGSLRQVAGLAGAAGLVVLWIMARQMFGPYVALLATALLTFAAVHVHFSRMALNVIEIPLFGMLGIALAWRGLRDAAPPWHLLAGFALGFSQFANFGARAFVLSTAGTYLVTLICRWRQWREIIGGGLLALGGMLAVMAPQIAHIRDDPGEMFDRLRFRSVFRRWEQATEIHGTDDPLGVMIGQAQINVQAFINVPDRGPFYGFTDDPLLFWPVAVLFLVGLIVALVRCRQPRYATILFVFGSVLLGGILSAGAPQFHRLLPLVPVACLLAAVTVEQLLVSVALILGRLNVPDRAMRAAWIVVPLVLVGATAVHDLTGLFVRHPAAAPWQPQSTWARWIEAQAPGSTLLIAGAPDVFAWDERLRLLSDGKVIQDVPNPSDDLPALTASGPILVALNPKLDDWVPLFDAEFPGLTFEPVFSPDGQLVLLEAILPVDQSAHQTERPLRGEIVIETRSDTSVLTRSDTAIAFRESSRLAGGESFEARWDGHLVVAQAGTYRLEVFTDGTAALDIDGKTVVEGRASPNPRSLRSDVRLTEGAHPLQLRYRYLRGPGTLELRWQPPGQARTIIPPSAFRPE